MHEPIPPSGSDPVGPAGELLAVVVVDALWGVACWWVPLGTAGSGVVLDVAATARAGEGRATVWLCEATAVRAREAPACVRARRRSAWCRRCEIGRVISRARAPKPGAIAAIVVRNAIRRVGGTAERLAPVAEAPGRRAVLPPPKLASVKTATETPSATATAGAAQRRNWCCDARDLADDSSTRERRRLGTAASAARSAVPVARRLAFVVGVSAVIAEAPAVTRRINSSTRSLFERSSVGAVAVSKRELDRSCSSTRVPDAGPASALAPGTSGVPVISPPSRPRASWDDPMAGTPTAPCAAGSRAFFRRRRAARSSVCFSVVGGDIRGTCVG
jgi:hypothetical protein